MTRTNTAPAAQRTRSAAAAATSRIRFSRPARHSVETILALLATVVTVNLSLVSARQYPLEAAAASSVNQQQSRSYLYTSLSLSHTRGLEQTSCPDSGEIFNNLWYAKYLLQLAICHAPQAVGCSYVASWCTAFSLLDYVYYIMP